MNKPHKHAEIIKAWADGKKIQFKWVEHYDWNDWTTGTPSFFNSCLYRVKPDSVRYRVCLMKGVTGGRYTTTAESNEDKESYESLESFDRWLTDWVEVEV